MSLLVVGALHWDVVVRAARLPRLDETLKGDTVDYRLGGKGGNQALAARRAGADVAFAGRIGSDTPGRTMRTALEQAGVDVSRLQQGSGASGMSVAITTHDGSYGAAIVSGENLKIDPHQVDLPPGCRIVLLQNEVSPHLLPAMAAKAHTAGAALWLNAAPATGLGPEQLDHVDVLIANRVEAADLLGTPPDAMDPPTAVERLRTIAPGARIVLTLGGDGVAFTDGTGAVRSAPARPVQVISTHGAGDVFVGTLAAAEIAGRSFPDAVAAAQDAAATHVAQIR
ncbi:MAG: PfkB family carbohydrate kinase [Pseudomonadota bacterium]